MDRNSKRQRDGQSNTLNKIFPAKKARANMGAGKLSTPTASPKKGRQSSDKEGSLPAKRGRKSDVDQDIVSSKSMRMGTLAGVLRASPGLPSTSITGEEGRLTPDRLHGRLVQCHSLKKTSGVLSFPPTKDDFASELFDLLVPAVKRSEAQRGEGVTSAVSGLNQANLGPVAEMGSKADDRTVADWLNGSEEPQVLSLAGGIAADDKFREACEGSSQPSSCRLQLAARDLGTENLTDEEEGPFSGQPQRLGGDSAREVLPGGHGDQQELFVKDKQAEPVRVPSSGDASPAKQVGNLPAGRWSTGISPLTSPLLSFFDRVMANQGQAGELHNGVVQHEESAPAKALPLLVASQTKNEVSAAVSPPEARVAVEQGGAIGKLLPSDGQAACSGGASSGGKGAFVYRDTLYCPGADFWEAAMNAASEAEGAPAAVAQPGPANPVSHPATVTVLSHHLKEPALGAARHTLQEPVSSPMPVRHITFLSPRVQQPVVAGTEIQPGSKLGSTDVSPSSSVKPGQPSPASSLSDPGSPAIVNDLVHATNTRAVQQTAPTTSPLVLAMSPSPPSADIFPPEPGGGAPTPTVAIGPPAATTTGPLSLVKQLAALSDTSPGPPQLSAIGTTSAEPKQLGLRSGSSDSTTPGSNYATERQAVLPISGLDAEGGSRGDGCKVGGLAAVVVANDGGSEVENRASPPEVAAPQALDRRVAAWLPDKACRLYEAKGVSEMWPWQAECLGLPDVLNGRSLVYCASTSAGKSLVAEVLMVRRILATRRKALLVLPYVALCSEKAEHMEQLLEPLGKRVRGFYGSQGGGTLPPDTDLAVCTIEKANILINKLMEESRLSEVGIVVIDELHMVGDEDRGYLLELLLTKLRYAAGGGVQPGTPAAAASPQSTETPSRSQDEIGGLQIVGMSATMPNVEAVASWLGAALYKTTFRPVPLEEFVKVDNIIYDSQMRPLRTLPIGASRNGKDKDHLVHLCDEVIRDCHSVLVFCASRQACQVTAKHLAQLMPPRAAPDNEEKDPKAALEELRRIPAGLDATLQETVPAGVAYHHAGLTVEEREVVETYFKKGAIKILTATSTLAAGVNLPARRVIFRQPRIGKDFIDAVRYRQMAGRAGRTGIDSKGESLLICTANEQASVQKLLREGCQPLESCLRESKRGMTRALLEVVAAGVVQTATDVQRYVHCTLLRATIGYEQVVASARAALAWLVKERFVEWEGASAVYTPTPLGRASFGSGLTPEESLLVFSDLARAREGFVLATELHTVFLVTPIYTDFKPEWKSMYSMFQKLTIHEQKVGGHVGVTEPFLMALAYGAVQLPAYRSRQAVAKRPAGSAVVSNEEQARIASRYFAALALTRLAQEVPLAEVGAQFSVPKGSLQSLQDAAGRFASLITTFCERLGWSDLQDLVKRFQNRVSFGVRAELADLTMIPHVRAYRARALFRAGLRTPQSVASASVQEVARALLASMPGGGAAVSAHQCRIQTMIARKVQRGAKEMILEQANEERAKAFANLRALGLTISEADVLPLPHHALFSSSEDPPADVAGPVASAAVAAPLNALLPSPIHPLPLSGPVRPTIVTSDRQNAPLAANNTPRLRVGGKEASPGVAVGVSSGVTVLTEVANGLEGTAKSAARAFGGTAVAELALPTAAPSAAPLEVLKLGGTASGPVDVDKMKGGFAAFCDLWKNVAEYIFDLHVMAQQTSQYSGGPFKMEGVAVCWRGSPVYYVPIARAKRPSRKQVGETVLPETAELVTDDSRSRVVLERWAMVKQALERKGVTKIGVDIKEQLSALSSAAFGRTTGATPAAVSDPPSAPKPQEMLPLEAVAPDDPLLDIKVASWLLDPDKESSRKVTLETLVKERLPPEQSRRANRMGRWEDEAGLNKSHSRAAANGCCRRAAQTRELWHWLCNKLKAEQLVAPMLRVEMPLARVLKDMERWGIAIDLQRCCKHKQPLVAKLQWLEQKAAALAGTSFSLGSPQEVASILYERLKLPPPPGSNKTKQHVSTDKAALEALSDLHPIVPVIREHRTLAKLLHSTVEALIQSARAVKGQHKIFGRWLQTAASTGRLAMEEPSLQCIQHSISFLAGGGEDQLVEVNVRDVLVPSEKGWVLMSADYSQIEVRMMAHFSGDPGLLRLLSQPGGDLFRLIAAQWRGVPQTEITQRQRDTAKQLIYGILYGMGVEALAEKLGCSPGEASAYRAEFLAAFPGVTRWMEETQESCRKKGYVEILCGRRRYLDKINDARGREKARAERQAVNSLCQGSAADLIKLAMIRVHEVITVCREPLDGPQHGGSPVGKRRRLGGDLVGRCRLLLQIHDELLLEVEETRAADAAAMVREAMGTALQLKVPLEVKVKVGPSWGSLRPYDEREAPISAGGLVVMSQNGSPGAMLPTDDSPIRRGG